MRPALRPPRTISAPVGVAPQSYRPWVEVTALVRVSVASWDLSEEGWVHWAVPVAAGHADLAGAVAFDPGRRAGAPGEPPAEEHAGESALDEAEASRLCVALAERWKPRVHFHTGLRVASRLDEPIEAFRRRCLTLFGSMLPRKDFAGRGGDLARIAATVESRVLSGSEMETVCWRVGVAWYPAGVEPATAPEPPMTLGSQGHGR